MPELCSNKKVSIILPVYNGEKYVADAIDSIINQTYTNIELIIVNDCSTDNTVLILESYVKKDSRIRVINNSENLKLPGTLNVGFKYAAGEYYTWTSDDNIYKETAIEKMVTELDLNLDVDMVYAGYTIIDENGKELAEIQAGHFKQLAKGNVVGACFLYRRDVAMKVGGYDQNLFLAEDYDYWIRISKIGKMKSISENLYLYRRHVASLTTSKNVQVENQTYRVIEKHFLYLYSLMKNRREKRDFLKNIEDRGKNFDRAKVLEQIINVFPSYRYYIMYRETRRKLGRIFYGLKGLLLK